MSELLAHLHEMPGIVLILGAFLLPFLPRNVRGVAMVALPMLSYAHLLQLDSTAGDLLDYQRVRVADEF